MMLYNGEITARDADTGKEAPEYCIKFVDPPGHPDSGTATRGSRSTNQSSDSLP
jgi:hypothetical protein